jgi:hypothetical protein
MKNENKQMLIEKSKSDIAKLTKNLNDELAKIHVFSTDVELSAIFKECSEIITKTNDKIEKFKKLTTNNHE